MFVICLQFLRKDYIYWLANDKIFDSYLWSTVDTFHCLMAEILEFDVEKQKIGDLKD